MVCGLIATMKYITSNARLLYLIQAFGSKYPYRMVMMRVHHIGRKPSVSNSEPPPVGARLSSCNLMLIRSFVPCNMTCSSIFVADHVGQPLCLIQCVA
jgi:hypothetical protein